VHPGVPTSVTAGADLPSWTFDSLRRFDRRARLWLIWASPPPASALVLADLAPAVLPRAAALLHPFECHRHPSLSFRCPSGYDRRPTPGLIFSCPPRERDVLGPAPLMGFCSLQRSSAQRIRFFPGDSHVPSRCVLRVLTPLDALIPFTPSRTFPPGAAPGIAPFRAFLLPLVRRSFPSWRALLALPDLTLER
jgi:hypothetical protein